jgi:glycosyltransferase involved in cell wall biosynthesis
MVGGGPERPRLERLARKLGVAHRIRFLGQVPRVELSELFAEAAAAVFTGVREEGGLALAEAMVSGTPVIVLDHGGPRALAAGATDDDRVKRVSPGTIRETVRRLAEAMTAAARAPASSTAPLLDRAAARRTLRESFESLGFDFGKPGPA